jgi:hypothetical protein
MVRSATPVACRLKGSSLNNGLSITGAPPDTGADTEATIVTPCSYELNQSPRLAADTGRDTGADTEYKEGNRKEITLRCSYSQRAKARGWGRTLFKALGTEGMVTMMRDTPTATELRIVTLCSYGLYQPPRLLGATGRAQGTAPQYKEEEKKEKRICAAVVGLFAQSVARPTQSAPTTRRATRPALIQSALHSTASPPRAKDESVAQWPALGRRAGRAIGTATAGIGCVERVGTSDECGCGNTVIAASIAGSPAGTAAR